MYQVYGIWTEYKLRETTSFIGSAKSNVNSVESDVLSALYWLSILMTRVTVSFNNGFILSDV